MSELFSTHLLPVCELLWPLSISFFFSKLVMRAEVRLVSQFQISEIYNKPRIVHMLSVAKIITKIGLKRNYTKNWGYSKVKLSSLQTSVPKSSKQINCVLDVRTKSKSALPRRRYKYFHVCMEEWPIACIDFLSQLPLDH